MGRYTKPAMLVIAALGAVAGGAGCGSSSSPQVTATVTVTPSAPSAAAATTPQAPASTPAATTAPAAPSAPAVPASAFTVCSDPGAICAGTMKTKPAMIITSGDSSMFVKVTSWSGWGNATAYGTGTLEIDDCNPSCAQGTFTGHPATVQLSGLTPYAGGKRAYTEMQVISPPNSMSFHHLLP